MWKVTGKSKICRGFFALKACCFAGWCLSPLPHARIRHIDMEEALGDFAGCKARFDRPTHIPAASRQP